MAKNSSEIKLNVEQKEAVEHGEGPLLIIAGAGTGKTSVITERIKYLILSEIVRPSEILALTFTEKAAREMEERVDVAMPYGYTQMWISTFHSFCDRILRAQALHVGLDPKYHLMTEAETIQFVRTHLFEFDLSYFRPLGNPIKFVGGLVQHFSRLADEDIEPAEYLRWVKSQNTKEKQEREKWLELAKAFQKYEELKVKEGVMDFADLISNTLKLFRTRPNVLREYQKQFKYILVDEFQDTNIAQNELVKLLAGPKGNLTVVADDDQCLPPEADISTPQGIKKIKKIQPGDGVITAVGKGHTSVSKVLRVFKRKRKVRLLSFRTEDGKGITVTDNHKMFCFLPAFYRPKDWYFVYLMHQKDLGWRLGVTNNLPARLRLERHADKILAIGSYKTEEEARFYEAYFSTKYGLPTVPFTARPNQAIQGEWLTRLFKELDTEKNARVLSSDLRLELDSPQFLVGGVTRGVSNRVKVNLLMCHRNYRSKTHKDGFVGNPGVMHMVQIETSNPKAIVALKEARFSLRRAKKGWKFQQATTDLAKAWHVADKAVTITGGILDKKFTVGMFNYQHLPARIVPASHILPGMYLPALDGKRVVYKMVVSRREKEKETETYDLEIDKTHNFIADGIVVHNSIYKWRGAAVSNVIQFKKTFPQAKIVTLVQNYRSTQEILDHAYRLIQHNNPDRLEVKENIDKKLVSVRKITGVTPEFIHTDRVENEADLVVKKILQFIEGEKREFSDFAILVRANNHSEPFVRALARAGVPYQFLGPGQLFRQPEVKEIIAYLKILYNFEDSVAFYRVLTLDHFDIPARDVASIINYARKLNLSLFEAAEKVDDPPAGEAGIFVSEAGKKKVSDLIAMIHRHLKLLPRETAGQIAYYFLEDSGILKKIVDPKTAQDEKRAQNFSRFFDKLKTYEVEHEDASVFAVVDWIDLSMELRESPQASDFDWTRENAVNILTVHSAKGLEFPVVFIANLVAQRFPTIERREQIPIPDQLIKEILPEGDYHLEEERRLFYVAMTRARDRLLVTAADYYGEGKREKKISPFVIETLGEEVVKGEIVKSEQLSILDFAPLPSEAQALEGPLPTRSITYLSYSQIDTFRFCPLHYKLKYIIKIPAPPTAAQSFGTSLHSTLKDFNEVLKRGELPKGKGRLEKFLLELYEKNWKSVGYVGKSHEQKTKKKGERYLFSYLKSNLFKPENPPRLLEQPFVFPLTGNLKVGGKIDRIDSAQDGIEIIDYKTTDVTTRQLPTQEDLAKDLQLSIYAMAANKVNHPIFNKNPQDVTLSLYFFDKGIKVSTKRKTQDLKKAADEILKVKEQIEASDFDCSGNFWCQDCEYKLFCEAKF